MTQFPPFDERGLRPRWMSAGAATTPSSAPSGSEFAGSRRTPLETCLTPVAHDWLNQLPPHYQPLVTARVHPHIVNRLSAVWSKSEDLAAYFRDLLQTSRQRRGGFSLGVLTELTDLKAWLDKMKSMGEGMVNEQQQLLCQTKQKAVFPGERMVDQRR
jgi:hypothetical protein